MYVSLYFFRVQITSILSMQNLSIEGLETKKSFNFESEFCDMRKTRAKI